MKPELILPAHKSQYVARLRLQKFLIYEIKKHPQLCKLSFLQTDF